MAIVLYKLIHFIKDRLIVKLALAVTLLLSIMYCISGPLQTGMYALLDYYYITLGNMAKEDAACRENFQEYVTENQVTSEDIEAICEWNYEYPDVSLVLTDDTYIRYSTSANYNQSFERLADYYNFHTTQELISSHTELYYMTFYGVTFADGVTLFASIESYSYTRVYLFAYYLYLLILFLLFLIPILLIVRSKISYIKRLANELRILESGDLTYSVTEKSSDELYQLAHGINQMRLSILEKQHQADANQNANQKLITSLSHDLRTPLPSIIGYLEIMKQHKYRDEAQLQEFLEKSSEKAFLMKDLSDKIFEYFLVSQRIYEEYHMEKIPVSDLITSLLDNMVFDLENLGFSVEAPLLAEQYKGACRMDVEFMQRVLNNILSNIRKYADITVPIAIAASEHNHFFELSFTNGIVEEDAEKESTGIGLKTCEKIMREHSGSLVTQTKDHTFTIRIMLPLIHVQQ
ncbi:MAG: HAMP domain-containing histidine kinase [Lachnospiraceae bacterium]|nr:HAMP domain-containing histidine kinase [Lachnospiraceae bacterium]